MTNDVQFDHWYTLALRYLQRRHRSEKEITDYLIKKKAPEKTIISIIGKLRPQNFVNDSEFAKWWIEQRTRFKPKGRYYIEQELQQKGIAKEVIASVYTDNAPIIIPDKQKAIDLLERKKGKYENLSRHERYQKLGSFLARRGFDYETIKQSIDEVFGK